MPKELVCFIDPFAAQWKVVDTDEEFETFVSFDTFSDVLDLCEERGATTFHIVGSEEYAKAMTEIFNRLQMSKYKEYKVEVEVN